MTPRPKTKTREVCVWMHNGNSYGVWAAGCNDNANRRLWNAEKKHGPDSEGWKFCAFCGLPLRERKATK